MAIAPISRDLIRVGYISPTEGYVRGLTVSDANNYDKLNGGKKYEPITRTYDVINNGAGNYEFTGAATGSNPTLNVTVGDTLVFNLVAIGHPFWVKTRKVRGTGDGVTTGNIKNNGSEKGTIIWNTTGVKPGTYYYVCQNHTSMQGVINVTAPTGGILYIFQDGDGKIRYLTIDEVNQLTIKDLLRSDVCNTGPKPCTSPLINFFGGDGIGAEGNAVIDKNGVILAVDLVNGGYGYSSRPLAQVIDPCNNGSGAVLDTEIKNGRVVRVIVIDGGVGYLPPPQTAPQYPALLQLKDVVVRKTGINYNCGVDEVTVCVDRDGTTRKEPNGTVLTYQCDPFGRIRQVQVVRGGTFSENIRICVHSKTGVNAELIPVFEVVRDPLFTEKEKDFRNVVQVYDLIGLSVQGYVDGKPYYGRVYFENDAKFAGVPGTSKPIPVYDTKTESILKATQSTTGDFVRIVGAVEGEVTETVPVSTPEPTPAAAPTPRIDIAPVIDIAPPPPPPPAPTPTPTPAPTPYSPPPSSPPPAPSPPPPPSPSPGGGGGGGGYGY